MRNVYTENNRMHYSLSTQDKSLGRFPLRVNIFRWDVETTQAHMYSTVWGEWGIKKKGDGELRDLPVFCSSQLNTLISLLCRKRGRGTPMNSQSQGANLVRVFRILTSLNNTAASLCSSPLAEESVKKKKRWGSFFFFFFFNSGRWPWIWCVQKTPHRFRGQRARAGVVRRHLLSCFVPSPVAYLLPPRLTFVAQEASKVKPRVAALCSALNREQKSRNVRGDGRKTLRGASTKAQDLLELAVIV